MKFQERIKERMNALGINQTDLAKLVGVKQASIWSLLQGDIEKPRFILELAVALKTTPEWLIHGTKEQAPPPINNTSKALLGELAKAAIKATSGTKSKEVIVEMQGLISAYFYPDLERGQTPSYEQILRMAKALIDAKD